MSYKCKEKQRKYQQDLYQKNKEKYRQRLEKARDDRAKWFLEIKSNLCCEICGENHPACLVFHHSNQQDKVACVSVMVTQAFSEKKILEEIAKCKVWCSNCHQKHHWENDHRRAKQIEVATYVIVC